MERNINIAIEIFIEISVIIFTLHYMSWTRQQVFVFGLGKDLNDFKGLNTNCVERIIFMESLEVFIKLQWYFSEVTCPKLPVPAHATHIDKACDGANSVCTSSCRISCKAGYKLVGNIAVYCHGSGKWDREQGSCVGKYIQLFYGFLLFFYIFI